MRGQRTNPKGLSDFGTSEGLNSETHFNSQCSGNTVVEVSGLPLAAPKVDQ